MDYQFTEIESKWQAYWRENNTYKVEADQAKPKFYVLDMFPYPSGAGLHVGHPLGYIASDIYSRYKTLKGFNVLHPMGYDAFGLPAEQYAIQTGQHPAITTEANIKRYREQLDRIGFSFDWSREVRTSDPGYYKWTQWAFIQMFNHWYNLKTDKAEPIEALVQQFVQDGNEKVQAATSQEEMFSADEWKAMTHEAQQEVLLNYRLAYLADTMVNWCPELGTVLANDEVVDGVSERGGHPVVQKEMKQWSLRISAYAQRLLDGLETVDWTDSLKEIQRNWIGRSEGAEVLFTVKDSEEEITVFTTRPDTLWGASFMVLAPESELVPILTRADQQEEIENYITETQKRSERERMADAKSVTGAFTGSYAINPITGHEIPIYISDYVLMGYGTGAIMAVPGHDSRDFKFARKFGLPIIQVVVKNGETPSDPATWDDSYDSKEGVMINSGFINGLEVTEAITKTINYLEEKELGTGKINYRLRDAIFSRQRYWGEPFPVYFKGHLPYTIDESQLPLLLPEVDKYLPTEDGQPPLGRATEWKTNDGHPYELSTMPGFAGSSAYMYRYMDPRNDTELVSKQSNEYWRNVDLYLGGSEHATGHLIYARFWNKFLFDLGKVCEDEPFKKLINQGMIQGRSNLVYRIKDTNQFVTLEKKDEYEVTPLHVDVNMVENDVLDIEQFRKWRSEFADAAFILNEDDRYKCGYAIEKMSKRYYNVVNPDDISERYGADTLRMYEMFLGPLEQSKPWDTNGIDGVHKFLKKLWRLFFDRDGTLLVKASDPTRDELKTLHKTIKKVGEDIEKFSFNTSISAFMICVNELNELKCNNKEILEQFIIVLSPFAPHICEELWSHLGHKESVTKASFPEFNGGYLIESTFEYPVSFNGKMRFKLELPMDVTKEDAEKAVLEHELAQRWLEGKQVHKVIVVPKRIINIVIG
jgi:leucyl-tRNA synthetase